MIDPKLIELLQCPIDGTELQLANAELIAQLNDAIARGELRDTSDQKITEPLDEGLQTRDGKRLYPVRGSIPTLIAEQSIDLSKNSN